MTYSELKDLLTRAAQLLDESAATSKAGRLELAKELHAAAADIPPIEEDDVDEDVIPAPLGAESENARGFQMIHFKDAYDVACTLQQSSLAELTQPGASAVWLGIDNVEPMVMSRDAHLVGLKAKSDVGWMPFPIPPEVKISARMHLRRSQVLSLITALTVWYETGEFTWRNEN